MALVGFGLSTAGLIWGLQYTLFGHPNLKLAVTVGVAVAVLFIGPARRFAKRRVASRRRAWIAKAVREGASEAELEALLPVSPRRRR